MSTLASPLTGNLRELSQSFNRFWFEPSDPHTLAMVRLCGGAMLLYTHLIWGLELSHFLGPKAIVTTDTALRMSTAVDGANYTWSYLWYVQSPLLIGILHWLGIIPFVALMVGFKTRWFAPICWVYTMSYCHRLIGLQYGLDQVNSMLATYFMVSAAPQVLSVDAWLAKRAGKPIKLRDEWTTVALRLIQCHMCVIYFFGGISKMRGGLWWDGSAFWFAVANLEYQSLDMTWLVDFRWLVAGLTMATFLWEMFYPITVWPMKTRWPTLLMAVMVHGGIALALGMKTFGMAMIFGNMAFVPASTMRAALAKIGIKTDGTEEAHA